ncbi:response regulator [Desulfobacterales bacterium HSG16]|nr:response regulator [Desulfobacterales bacterium HSG16]
MTDESFKANILVVDDAPESIRILVDSLMPDYEVSVALNGVEALKIAASDSAPDLILLDIVMPGLDGYEVCRRLKADEKTENIPIIFITGKNQASDEAKGLELNAVDYIVKPFCTNIVKARIRTHLELKGQRDNLECMDTLVQTRTQELIQTNKELLESSAKLQRILEQTVNALRSSVEMKDPYTAGHQVRVKQLACAIAEKMNFSSQDIDGIRIAGLLHDIGKISVPSEILSKPGQLTKTEFNLLKEHSIFGYEILKGIEFPRPVAQIILQHHERINGTGYPLGITGDKMLPESKVLCVADVVESMSTHRPYRASLGIETALEEIKRRRGSYYDPVPVDICLSLFNNGFVFK